MTNWKTTVGGILSMIGLALTASSNSILHLVGVILAAGGTFLTGALATDAVAK